MFFFCIVVSALQVVIKITVIVILNERCSLTNEELVKAVVLFTVAYPGFHIGGTAGVPLPLLPFPFSLPFPSLPPLRSRPLKYSYGLGERL